MRWILVSKMQLDGGLDIVGLKHRNFGLIAKWGWRFMLESDSFWSKVIMSTHGSNLHEWHTSGKNVMSCCSPWMNISKVWKQVESFASFKPGNDGRILF